MCEQQKQLGILSPCAEIYFSPTEMLSLKDKSLYQAMENKCNKPAKEPNSEKSQRHSAAKW